MIRFLAGVVVGTLGATYLIAMFLPASREEPVPQRTLGGPVFWGKSDDTRSWTSGPLT